MSCVLARFMKMRSGNPGVAIMAISETLLEEQERLQRLAAEEARSPSYVTVAASPSRVTRSRAAQNASPAGRGNTDVAGNVQNPAAKETKVESPPPDAPPAAPAEGGPPPARRTGG